MGRFLSKKELETMTGYTQPAAQRRWLTDNGYRFDVRGDGRPAVLWQQIEARLAPTSPQRASGPNLDALDMFE